MRQAVFCGSFSPFTMGHLDILKQASEVFDKIYIALPCVCTKEYRLSTEQRVKIIKETIGESSFIEIVTFSGGLSDFCKAMGVYTLIRGIRNANDLVVENELLRNYQTQDSRIRGVYFLSQPELAHISSSVVCELVRVGGNISSHVHKNALKLVEQYLKGS